jgi:3-oxoacid CoA-transferase B subunit
MLGLKGFPLKGQEDPDLIDPSKQTIQADFGASYSSSSDAFGLVRGSHLFATFLGTMEVSETGDLANWIIPRKLVKGMGGAMDLVASGSKLFVLSEHNTKEGKPKILKKCSLPLTGQKCVSKIITELAVFEVRPH